MTRSGHHASIGAAKEGELGTILVDSKGRTLYLFRRDPGPESTCLGACASAWPPLRATGKPTVSGGADGSLVGTSPRSDGRQQVTYNGHPLYLYAGDEKAGDTRGEGLTDFGASWYALTPSGQQVSGQASRSYGSSKASVPLAYVVPALAPRARAFIHRANGGLPRQSLIVGDRPHREGGRAHAAASASRELESDRAFEMTRFINRAISMGAIVVLSVLFVRRAEAHVYWTNNGDTTIGRANLDGTAVNQSLISGGFNPCGVAVDGAHVYWGNIGAGTIGRANLDGSGANQSFIGDQVGPCGVAVDGGHVYWADTNGGAIGRANLDGGGANQDFIAGVDAPCGVAVDGAHVYWGTVAAGTIGRANLDGSGANQAFIGGATGACGVAVDGAHVYWSNGGAGTIGRANLEGTGVNQAFIAGAPRPCGIALDAGHLYWTNSDNGTIGRANLDGTGVNQSFIGGATLPCRVAVDADPTGGVEDPGGGGVITNPPPPIGGVEDPVGGGGVITNPPPPVDTAAQLPTLGKIRIARRHRRLVARVPVSCPTGEAGGCRTTLRPATANKIRRGKVRAAVVLGSKQVNLGPGQRLTVSIRLARSAAGFAKHGTLATRIRITSSDAAGNSAARSVTRRLRIPRR